LSLSVTLRFTLDKAKKQTENVEKSVVAAEHTDDWNYAENYSTTVYSRPTTQYYTPNQVGNS